MSTYTSYVIAEADKQLMLQRELRYMIRVEILDTDYKIIDNIEGSVVGGSYNIESTSDIRRNASFTINPTLISKDCPMIVNPYGYVWFDKIIHFYIGLMNVVTKEFTYYSEGYYQYINVQSSYDAATNQLTITLNDYMSVLNGTRNGQIGTPVIIPSYEFTENNDGSIDIYKYNLLRDALKAVLVNLGNIPASKVLIGEMGATNGLPELQENYLAYRNDYPYWASVPYDLEFNSGSSVLQIANELRDLYPNFETFFSPDNNTFVCQLIPSGYNDVITFDNDFIQRILISEQSAVDLTEVKNVCEVWGRVLNPKYYASECHSGYENALSLLTKYHNDLISKVVDNVILAFTADVTTQTEAVNELSATIENIRSNISSEETTLNNTKSSISTYEASVGKSIEMMREGRESVYNDNTAEYPNYKFAYHDNRGLMSSSDYNTMVAILAAITRDYTWRHTLNDSERLWMNNMKSTLYANTKDDKELESRAATTMNYIIHLVNQCAFTGVIANYNKVNASAITERQVITFLENNGYTDKMLYYDEESKVEFIERYVKKGEAAFSNYFGSKASSVRSQLHVEIGSYGVIYFNAYKNLYAGEVRKAALEASEANFSRLKEVADDNVEFADTSIPIAEAKIESLRNERVAYLRKLDEISADMAITQSRLVKSYANHNEHNIAKYTKQLQSLRTEQEHFAAAIEDANIQIDQLLKDLEVYNEQKSYNTALSARYEAQIVSLQNQVTNVENTIILPNQNTCDIYKILISNNEAQLEAAYTLYTSTKQAIADSEKTLNEEQEKLTAATEARDSAQNNLNKANSYKSSIIDAYDALTAYIQANPSTAPSDEAKTYADTIIDGYDALKSSFSNYSGDSGEVSKLFADNATAFDNIEILLNGYKINSVGEDMFTYKITLDNYTQYTNGDSIAIKINAVNDSPTLFLQINTLPILPLYRSKALTDEAAINNFIEQGTLKKNAVYVFRIDNINTSRTNLISWEEEKDTSVFAYLQGGFQLHGIDVLSDGRELTDYYYVQKVEETDTDGTSTDSTDWSDKRKRIHDGVDSSVLVDEDYQFDEFGEPEKEIALDDDGNPIYLYSREYFEKRYNCQNIHFTIVPDSPYTIERLGEILDVKSGDRYNNCNTDLEILENAKYENWKNSRLTDTITITTFLCPFFDVNVKVTYKPKIIQLNNSISDNPADDEPYEYLIKSVSHDLSGLTSTVVMYRYYPLFDRENNEYPRY